MWDKGYYGRECWDERIGKDHEMRMLSGSTSTHVGMGDRRIEEKLMVDVGLMEEWWKDAWGYRDPRWI